MNKKEKMNIFVKPDEQSQAIIKKKVKHIVFDLNVSIR